MKRGNEGRKAVCRKKPPITLVKGEQHVKTSQAQGKGMWWKKLRKKETKKDERVIKHDARGKGGGKVHHTKKQRKGGMASPELPKHGCYKDLNKTPAARGWAGTAKVACRTKDGARWVINSLKANMNHECRHEEWVSNGTGVSEEIIEGEEKSMNKKTGENQKMAT